MENKMTNRITETELLLPSLIHNHCSVTGLRIKSLLARRDKIGPGRVLDDNASIMVEYEEGAKGLF
jgi:hypothetical protein